MNNKVEKKELELLQEKRNRLLEEEIKILKNSRRWIVAKEGERIGHGSYFVNIKSLMLESEFMGYATVYEQQLCFPANRACRSFNCISQIGDIKMSKRLCDALIALLKAELLKPMVI